MSDDFGFLDKKVKERIDKQFNKKNERIEELEQRVRSLEKLVDQLIKDVYYLKSKHLIMR